MIRSVTVGDVSEVAVTVHDSGALALGIVVKKISSKAGGLFT